MPKQTLYPRPVQVIFDYFCLFLLISKCMNRHRHQEWLNFLRHIAKSVSSDKEIHIICVNYASHKHLKVRAWQNVTLASIFTSLQPAPHGSTWLSGSSET